jgi:HEAT repeat protein
MPIDTSSDRPGRSLRTLVWQALTQYPTESLFQFLHDPSSIVRTAAARELQGRPEIEAVHHYAVSLTNSRKSREREIAAFLFGQIGTPHRPLKAKSIPLLEKLCADEDAEVRETALASLGHLGAKEAKALIQEAKNDPVASVREMASYVSDWVEGFPSEADD